MQHRKACIFLILALLSCSFSVFGSEQKDSCYAFAYFTGSGSSGMHLAVSTDALHWTAVKGGQPILPSPIGNKVKLIRDPSIVKGTDGFFHLVWTVAWDGKHFAYAKSRDLLNWTDIKTVPAMTKEPTTRNVWAPELFYDEPSKQYYIIWSSTIPIRFSKAGSSENRYDHRVYYMTTKDFKTFSSTKLYFDPGHNVIDAFLLKENGIYYLFYKDERLYPEKKSIHCTSARSPEGPFTPGPEIAPQNWVEGPAAISVNGSCLVYFDCYRDGKYGAVRSKDFKNWENISDKISLPKGIRHGTIFPIDKEIYDVLLKQK